MQPQPVDEFVAMSLTGGDVEHQPLLLIDGGVDLEAVQEQENLHRRVADALVAIDEGVIRGQGEPQGRSLFDDGGMQIGGVEGCFGLGQCRLEKAEVTDPPGATGLVYDAPVQGDDSPSVR
ncbi:MAG: hypothetical protein U0Q55_06355 [Vicinamibacterales bacterium]